MWTAIVNFLASIIDLFFKLTGNFGVAVILFTVLVKGLMLPLDIKSKKSTAKIQEINPEIQRISEKYANDPEKRSKKLQEVYTANHINPLGGCLPMLITMPLVIIIFAALRQIAAQHMFVYLQQLLVDADASMGAVIDSILVSLEGSDVITSSFKDILPKLFNNSGELVKGLEKLPEVIGEDTWNALQGAIKSVTFEQGQATAREMGYSFLWIKNIWAPDSPLKSILGTSFSIRSLFGSGAGTYWALCNGFFILPVISTASQYLHTYLMNRKSKQVQKDYDEQHKKKKSSKTENAADPQASMKLMNKILPLMSLYFCATYNGAFALYWTISNFVSIAQFFVTERILNKKKSVKE